MRPGSAAAAGASTGRPSHHHVRATAASVATKRPAARSMQRPSRVAFVARGNARRLHLARSERRLPRPRGPSTAYGPRPIIQMPDRRWTNDPSSAIDERLIRRRNPPLSCLIATAWEVPSGRTRPASRQQTTMVRPVVRNFAMLGLCGDDGRCAGGLLRPERRAETGRAGQGRRTRQGHHRHASTTLPMPPAP